MIINQISLQVEENLDSAIQQIVHTQPYLIVQCDDINDENQYVTLIVDGKKFPMGHISYERGIELIIKCSYVFNLKFEKSVENILNFYAAKILNIKMISMKASVIRFYDYIKS